MRETPKLIDWRVYLPDPLTTAEETAAGMLSILVSRKTPPEYTETRVLSEHNGVAIEATSGDTVDSLVLKWDEARIRGVLAAQRVEPVRVAIAYLLDSLNEGDRDFLIRNFKHVVKKEDGVLCLR